MFSPPDYSDPSTFLRPRLGPWTVSIWLHRKPILNAVKAAAPALTGDLLDVGCGNKPYGSLLCCSRHVGVDVATSPHVRERFDATFDGRTLPFPDGAFDSVLCTEVVEHSADPRRLAEEIGRVLRPGGHALVTAPFVFHHHEVPYDYQRFTKYGMEELARAAGLVVKWIRPRGGAFAVYLSGMYLASSLLIGRRPFSDALMWLLFPIALAALAMDRWRGRPNVVSLGWQMLARKPGNDLSAADCRQTTEK